jgi:subtilisin family serine protease
MRAPRRLSFLVAIAAVAGGLAVALAAGGTDPSGTTTASWRGLVDTRADVSLAGRYVVVLKTPSLGQRLATEGYATEAQERAWTSQAFAAQRQVLTTLALEGASVQPEFSYARVLDGFAAPLDPQAVALLERNPEIQGVYPVRAAFPASLSSSVLSGPAFAAASGRRVNVSLPGFDGDGVTIALLDTGVDASQPFLHGHVLPGYDEIDHSDGQNGARTDPQDASLVERHGTEMAGLLVGAGGPAGLHGVAPGADVLPIRVAGWQLDASGADAVYARSDQLIAGLERAVDPNGDGDAHDAARIALVGVAEPYAAFADDPEAQAVQGATDLSTLVVAPAGNDGAAGPAFGSVAGPAGAPAALAVAASDGRATLPTVRLVLRRGLDVILDRKVPLAGAVAPSRSLSLAVAEPRATTGTVGATAADFFDARGFSTVAGKAVVVPAGGDPAATATRAARAGAAAVVLYGSALPADSLGLSDALSVPVVSVPTADALELLAARRAGASVGIALGRASEPANTANGDVAPFSSRGLAFDGRLKPDLAAPGISLATSEPGRAADGSPSWGTVDGTSGAAATVAGAAALLAQVRPALDASDLKSLLVGNADASGAATAVGAGELDLGAAAVGEVSASPATLTFGTWSGPHWRAAQTVTVRNVSSRRLQLSLAVASDGDPEALRFTVKPAAVALKAGAETTVTVEVAAPHRPTAAAITGALRISPAGAATLRVPFALASQVPATRLLSKATISKTTFTPSDTSPAILTVQAGRLAEQGGAVQIAPVARLDLLLYDADGRFRGVLGRVRDLLPGSYSFGITGRDATSVRLPPGSYQVRLVAWPTEDGTGAPSRAHVSFHIE